MYNAFFKNCIIIIISHGHSTAGALSTQDPKS